MGKVDYTRKIAEYLPLNSVNMRKVRPANGIVAPDCNAVLNPSYRTATHCYLTWMMPDRKLGVEIPGFNMDALTAGLGVDAWDFNLKCPFEPLFNNVGPFCNCNNKVDIAAPTIDDVYGYAKLFWEAGDITVIVEWGSEFLGHTPPATPIRMRWSLKADDVSFGGFSINDWIALDEHDTFKLYKNGRWLNGTPSPSTSDMADFYTCNLYYIDA